MANSNRVSWETDLRKQIRSNYGQGWTVIGENSGRTKLTYQYPNEPKKASNTLSLEWKKTNGLQILKAIEFISPLVRNENLPLKEAARRWKAQFIGDDIKAPNKAWQDFLIIPPEFSYNKEYKKAYAEYEAKLKATKVDQFMNTLQIKSSKTEKDWHTRIRRFLELINKRNAPKTGEELVKELARDFGDITADQKKRYINGWCKILNYGITRHSMPKRWTPPNTDIRKELKGSDTTTKQDKLTPYLEEHDLFRLLDDLESRDPEMFLATGLISIFGLRLSELAVLRVDKDMNLFVGHIKNNTNTTNKKRKERRVFACDLIEKPDLGKKLIGWYKSKLIKLPQTILTQIDLVEKKRSFGDVGQAFTDKLETNPIWQEIISKEGNEDITAYSMRHRFAHQLHKGSTNPISIKDAAKTMGHTVATHMNSYGSYTSELAIEKAFERHAQNRIEA